MNTRKTARVLTLAPAPSLASLGLGLASFALPQVVQAQGAVELDEVQIQGNAMNPQNLSSPKYTQPLRDVPQSISVIPKELIERQNAQTLEDVLRNVPGITFNSGEGAGGVGDTINIRGFNSNLYGGSNVYRDGVRESAFYTRSEMFNTEQVEVVKGSSSAAWGAGVIGGGVNLVSKSAYLGDLSRVTVGVGTAEYRRLALDSNKVLNSDLGIAARLNLVATESGVNGRDWISRNRWGIAPSVAFGLNTATRLNLGYEHLDDRGNYDYGIPASHGGQLARVGGKVRKAPGVDWDSYWGFRNLDRENNRTDRFNFKIEHDFSEALTLSNQFVYGKLQREYVVTTPEGSFLVPPQNGSGRRLIGVARHVNEDTLSNITNLTFKFETLGISHTLVSGMEYTREKLDQKNGGLRYGNQGNGGMGGPFNPVDRKHPPSRFVGNKEIAYTTRTEAQATTQAIYVLDTLKFNEQWQADVSLRRDWWKAENDKVQRRTNTGGALGNWAINPAASALEVKNRLFSYRAALTFKPIEQASLYAAYGNAKQPSSISATTAGGVDTTDDVLSPTKGKTYEVGGKWDLFDEALGLSAALFRTDLDGSVLNGDTPPSLMPFKQRVDGLELAATGSITENWTVFAGYSYLKSKNRSDGRANSNEPGTEMHNVPKQSASLWNSYRLNQDWSIDYSVRYMDERHIGLGQGNNITKAQRATVPDYWVHDAAVNWQANKEVGVRLNMVNLLGEHYWRQYNGRGFGVPGEGRGAQLTLDYSF